MFDFDHDWKAWSGRERATAAAFAVGLMLMVLAWVVE
jgi:hypothetical protein